MQVLLNNETADVSYITQCRLYDKKNIAIDDYSLLDLKTIGISNLYKKYGFISRTGYDFIKKDIEAHFQNYIEICRMGVKPSLIKRIETSIKNDVKYLNTNFSMLRAIDRYKEIITTEEEVNNDKKAYEKFKNDITLPKCLSNALAETKNGLSILVGSMLDYNILNFYMEACNMPRIISVFNRKYYSAQAHDIRSACELYISKDKARKELFRSSFITFTFKNAPSTLEGSGYFKLALIDDIALNKDKTIWVTKIKNDSIKSGEASVMFVIPTQTLELVESPYLTLVLSDDAGGGGGVTDTTEYHFAIDVAKLQKENTNIVNCNLGVYRHAQHDYSNALDYIIKTNDDKSALFLIKKLRYTKKVKPEYVPNV